MSNDERKGLPSASSLLRLKRCPGSWQAIQSLPFDQRDKRTDEAEEGTARHDYIEREETNTGDEARDYCTARAIELRETAISAAMIDPLNATQITEERFWLNDENGKPLMSGKLDCAYVDSKKIGLVVDYKTMYADHGEARINLQLRFYALVIAKQYGLEMVSTALIQPMLPKERQLTMTVYDLEALEQSDRQIRDIIDDSKAHSAPRIPSYDACKYCAFSERCPEAQASAFAIAESSKDCLPDTIPTADELDRIQLAEKLLNKYAAARKAKALEALQANPDAIPGWGVKEGVKRKSIKSAAAVWQLIGNQIGGRAFQEACTVSLTKLVKPYQEALGIKSQAQSRKELEETLDSVIEETQNKPSLIKVK